MEKDYDKVKKALLFEYRDTDSHQVVYTLTFLETYKNIKHSKDSDISEYC